MSSNEFVDDMFGTLAAEPLLLLLGATVGIASEAEDEKLQNDEQAAD